MSTVLPPFYAGHPSICCFVYDVLYLLDTGVSTNYFITKTWFNRVRYEIQVEIVIVMIEV